jgi:uncharacterized membrane protein (UPF0182 family)
MRNSVKAVVDAYNGTVTLYAWDMSDPLLQAWSSVYGNTLTPISEISADLMSHLRYPESLFKMQRSLLATYHVQDATAFYSGQGFWRTPSDPTKADNVQPPYYLTLKMPSQDDATFSLTSTYIPIGTGAHARNILTGFLAVNSETGSTAGTVSPDYGKLRLLQLPQSATVSGPGQVQNLFNSNATVQETLRLLRDGGSQVINGNLLTLPVGGGLLYVQPVYVQSATGTQFPSLQKVLVSFGDKVGFADTLNEALDQVFSGDSGAVAGDAERPEGSGEVPSLDGEPPAGEPASPPASSEPSPGASPSESPVPPAESTEPAEPATPPGGQVTLDEALSRANQAMADSRTALAQGNWAAYGLAQDALAEALRDATLAQEGDTP